MKYYIFRLDIAELVITTIFVNLMNHAESPLQLPIPSPVHNINDTPNSVNISDIVAIAMFAALNKDNKLNSIVFCYLNVRN